MSGSGNCCGNCWASQSEGKSEDTERGKHCSGICALRQHSQPSSAKRAQRVQCVCGKPSLQVQFEVHSPCGAHSPRANLLRHAWHSARTGARAHSRSRTTVLRHCPPLARDSHGAKHAKEDLQVRVGTDSAARVAFHDMTSVSERHWAACREQFCREALHPGVVALIWSWSAAPNCAARTPQGSARKSGRHARHADVSPVSRCSERKCEALRGRSENMRGPERHGDDWRPGPACPALPTHSP